MRKFWGFYDNGTYRVGCNGGTVYIYNSQNKEIAKFKGFPYAYKAAFIGLLNVEEADFTDIKRLETGQYDYADAYKSWEINGFTEKSLQWKRELRDLKTITPISLKDIYNSI